MTWLVSTHSLHPEFAFPFVISRSHSSWSYLLSEFFLLSNRLEYRMHWACRHSTTLLSIRPNLQSAIHSLLFVPSRFLFIYFILFWHFFLSQSLVLNFYLKTYLLPAEPLYFSLNRRRFTASWREGGVFQKNTKWKVVQTWVDEFGFFWYRLSMFVSSGRVKQPRPCWRLSPRLRF